MAVAGHLRCAIEVVSYAGDVGISILIRSPMAGATMTPTELQSALARLDLSPAALARLLGVDVRTARRWATGGKPIPDSVAAQLTAMVAAGGVPTELVEQRLKVETEEATRFLWVRRRGVQEWTIAEHDVIANVFYLPGRVERYTASELVLGAAIEMPKA